ncbi:MAG: glucose/galactose MFS transporter, partial [Muribaculaceae bacterium]|nr:glucose/galactose MFS transporter [Muribaculaceae bacterium]
YTVMGMVVLAVALVFCRVKLPEITRQSAQPADAAAPDSSMAVIRGLLHNRRFMLGVMALFCYEISEISINSLFINYVTADGWMTPQRAAVVLSFGGLGLFMCARVAGSWIMSRVAAEKVLTVCAVMTVAGSLAVTLDLGILSKAGLFACYAFEAIMFPTVFAISLRGLGNSTKIASSFLMMSPIGGAVGTMLMGYVADTTSMSTSFAVPCAGYAAVLVYSLFVIRGKLD